MAKREELFSRKKKLCTFYVYLPFIKVTYTLKKISKKILIKKLQEHIELVCGIPQFMQHLNYLDMADLPLDNDLKSLDIVNNATFTLTVFSSWEKLVQRIYEKAHAGVLECINKTGCYDYSVAEMAAEYKRRVNTALFIAAHLGDTPLVIELIKAGADINASTDLGYTALHAALANGNYECIDKLLECGADNDTKSKAGRNALIVGKNHGHTDGERHLLMFEWRLRARNAKATQSKSVPMRQHQQFDSSYPTWFNGFYATKYMCSTLPCADFSGTALSAPKVKLVTPATYDEKGNYLYLSVVVIYIYR